MNLFSHVLDKLVYLLIISLLIVSPVVYGSVEPLAITLLQLQALLAFFIWVLWSMSKEDKTSVGLKMLLPLLLFVLVCIFQVIPLPEFLLRLVSWSSLDIWRENKDILSKIGFPGRGSLSTISLYPHGTWAQIVLLVSYIAFGIVVSKKLNTRAAITIILLTVIGVSLYEAFYGLYRYMLGIEMVPAEHLEPIVSASGTFVNRNHFAGFLEMTIPLIFGYALYLGNWRHGTPSFRDMISSDNFQKQFLVLFCTGIILFVFLFSKSRMGLFSLALALAFFYLNYTIYKKNVAGKPWLILFILFIALIFGLWVGLYSVFERFFQIEADSPGRILVWKDSLAAIHDFPLFGTGLGTFEYVYPLYKHAMDKPIFYSQMHNDYLQLMFETGIIGFIFIITAVVLYLYSSMKSLRRLANDNNPAFFLVLGSLSGVVALLIHSLADFNLHIPSNALYFAFLIGFSKSAANLEKIRIRRRERTSHERTHVHGESEYLM